MYGGERCILLTAEVMMYESWHFNCIFNGYRHNCLWVGGLSTPFRNGKCDEQRGVKIEGGSTPPLLPAPPSTGILCHVLSGFFAHVMTLNTVLSVQSRVACVCLSICLSVWPSLLLLRLSCGSEASCICAQVA